MCATSELRLFELDDTEWLKALKVGESTRFDGYGARRPCAGRAVLLHKSPLETEATNAFFHPWCTRQSRTS